jgi:hypothetical protein
MHFFYIYHGAGLTRRPAMALHGRLSFNPRSRGLPSSFVNTLTTYLLLQELVHLSCSNSQPHDARGRCTADDANLRTFHLMRSSSPCAAQLLYSLEARISHGFRTSLSLQIFSRSFPILCANEVDIKRRNLLESQTV